MALSLIIQRFDLTMADPSYTLSIKFTITVKPHGFHIRAKPRTGRHNIPLTPSCHGALSNRQPTPPVPGDYRSTSDVPRVYVIMARTLVRVKILRKGLRTTHPLMVRPRLLSLSTANPHSNFQASALWWIAWTQPRGVCPKMVPLSL